MIVGKMKIRGSQFNAEQCWVENESTHKRVNQCSKCKDPSRAIEIPISIIMLLTLRRNLCLMFMYVFTALYLCMDLSLSIIFDLRLKRFFGEEF